MHTELPHSEDGMAWCITGTVQAESGDTEELYQVDQGEHEMGKRAGMCLMLCFADHPCSHCRLTLSGKWSDEVGPMGACSHRQSRRGLPSHGTSRQSPSLLLCLCCLR